MSEPSVYEIGTQPPLGTVPKEMFAQMIRQDRFGEPHRAFAVEKIAVPSIKPDEVLVWVMAAGINYNNVWAGLGTPVDVTLAELAIETFLPADAETAAKLRQLGAMQA